MEVRPLSSHHSCDPFLSSRVSVFFLRGVKQSSQIFENNRKTLSIQLGFCLTGTITSKIWKPLGLCVVLRPQSKTQQRPTLGWVGQPNQCSGVSGRLGKRVTCASAKTAFLRCHLGVHSLHEAPHEFPAHCGDDIPVTSVPHAPALPPPLGSCSEVKSQKGMREGSRGG